MKGLKLETVMKKEKEWIKFDFVGTTPSGKTKIWDVVLKDQSVIGGQIRWWGAWRKYAFFPKSQTYYEADCLRTIARFCEDETNTHWRGILAVGQERAAEWFEAMRATL